MINFHHYGIAINDKNEHPELDWVYDMNQDMWVALSSISTCVEYVCSRHTNRFIGKPYYHLCYITDNISLYENQYNMLGYRKILDTTAKLFNNRRIIFLTNGEYYVELLEEL